MLRNRIRRMEALARGGPCPECKPPPDGPGYVLLEEGEEPPKEADERCPRCGRCLRIVLMVVYEDGPEEAAQEGGPR